MTLLDHGFILIIAIIYPIAGFISFRRLLRRAAAGESVNRNQLYRTTTTGHWTLFFVGMAIWAGAGRPWTGLGFALELDLWFALGAALTVVGIVVLVMQVRQLGTASTDEIDEIRKRIGKLAIMLPQNGNELARFYGVSITAGIVEEVLWRGFLIWYLGQFMPLWAAAVISAIGFGLAHAYQGLANVPQITAVGAAFTGLYLLTGSIWLPIVLHAAVDILQGRLTYEVLYRNNIGGGSSAEDDGRDPEILSAS